MGKFVGAFIFICTGVVFLVIGIILWTKHRITLIHDYHYQKVRKEDVNAYTEVMGKALFLIGISLVLSGITSIFDIRGVVIFIIGLIIGMVMIYKAQKKYNGGIF